MHNFIQNGATVGQGYWQLKSPLRTLISYLDDIKGSYVNLSQRPWSLTIPAGKSSGDLSRLRHHGLGSHLVNSESLLPDRRSAHLPTIPLLVQSRNEQGTRRSSLNRDDNLHSNHQGFEQAIHQTPSWPIKSEPAQSLTSGFSADLESSSA